jgi:hypothetical protein
VGEEMRPGHATRSWLREASSTDWLSAKSEEGIPGDPLSSFAGLAGAGGVRRHLERDADSVRPSADPYESHEGRAHRDASVQGRLGAVP